MRKIHFINYLQTHYHNVGDWNISPLNYYYSFFKDYNFIVHSTFKSSINWKEIDKDDIVIIGGGGLITPNKTGAINKLLKACNNVIGWGIGISRDDWSEIGNIDFSKFLLLRVRDYNNSLNLPYAPCVSCKLPELSYTTKIVREVGIVNHGGFKIEGLSFDSISNRVGLAEFIEFIASSNSIVTSSYHAALWSLWMGKKVVCANHEWSSKFDYYQYKPELISKDNVNDKSVYEAVARAEIYTGIRQEAIQMNDQFFMIVKKEIKRLIPKKGNDYRKVHELKTLTKVDAWCLDLHKRLKKLEDLQNK